MDLSAYLQLLDEAGPVVPMPSCRVPTLRRRVAEVEGLIGRRLIAADGAAWAVLAGQIVALDDAALDGLRRGAVPAFLQVH